MTPLKPRVPVLVAVLAGALVAALFVTFNALFSDGPTSILDGERLVTYAIAVVTHGLLAAVGARWGAWRWTRWVVVAAAPSAVVALLYAVSEPTIGAFAVLYALLAIGGASLGALAARPKPTPVA